MNPNIGENIKKLRNEKQVTQEQLAAHLLISCQAVSKWENNISTPDIFLLPAIAGYFEIQIDELFKINMEGYKNKAQRSLATYERTGKKEDFEKADTEYEKLIASNNADSRDLSDYGTLNQYYSNILAKEAECLMIQAISQGEEKAEGQLISLLASQGRNKESIVKYENMVKENPENSRYWHLLVFAYGGCGDGADTEKALNIAQKGIAKFPNDAGLFSMCGDMCKGLGRYDEAFLYWNKSMQLSPDMGSNYYAIAYAYQNLCRYEEAINAWENVIEFCKRGGWIESIGICEREIEKLKASLYL